MRRYKEDASIPVDFYNRAVAGPLAGMTMTPEVIGEIEKMGLEYFGKIGGGNNSALANNSEHWFFQKEGTDWEEIAEKLLG